MKSGMIKKTFFMLVLLAVNFYVFAQDSTYSASTTTNISTVTHEAWYMQKWAWIAGGGAFLLIIIAIMSSGNKSSKTDRVTVTKTVTTESE